MPFYLQLIKMFDGGKIKNYIKSTVIWDKDKTLGHPFIMYYNANGDTSNNTPNGDGSKGSVWL
jgi:hypothetical protein